MSTIDASRVRVATADDEDELMDICRKIHAEIGLFPISETKVRSAVKLALDGQMGVIGVIGEPGKIEGSICLIVSEAWYSESLMISEQWNYVLPEYRKSDNAAQLIAFSKKAAEDLKMRMLIGIVSNDRTEGKIRHYRRVLGEPIGAVFLYDGASHRMI